MIQVLVADDHPIVRQGIRQALAETDDIVVADEAGNCAEILERLRQNRFDVVLLDLSMPGRGGIEVLKQIRGMQVMVPVLVLSIFPEDQYAIRALRAGASGYVMKSCEAEVLVRAIRKVASGGTFVSEAMVEKLLGGLGKDVEKAPHELLSDREYEVFRRLAKGESVRDIAEGMALSVKTVSTYRGRILQKIHVKSNAELIRYALENKLVQ
jgi:two-component system invasion response regulator UvrY